MKNASKRKTIGEIYGLKEDDSGFGSWTVSEYNAILGKTPRDLTLIDIAYMLRQGMLLEVSIPKAVNLLAKKPYCGEDYEGQMVNSLACCPAFPEPFIEDIKGLLPDFKECFAKHRFVTYASKMHFAAAVKIIADRLEGRSMPPLNREENTKMPLSRIRELLSLGYRWSFYWNGNSCELSPLYLSDFSIDSGKVVFIDECGSGKIYASLEELVSCGHDVEKMVDYNINPSVYSPYWQIANI